MWRRWYRRPRRVGGRSRHDTAFSRAAQSGVAERISERPGNGAPRPLHHTPGPLALPGPMTLHRAEGPCIDLDQELISRCACAKRLFGGAAVPSRPSRSHRVQPRAVADDVAIGRLGKDA